MKRISSFASVSLCLLLTVFIIIPYILSMIGIHPVETFLFYTMLPFFYIQDLTSTYIAIILICLVCLIISFIYFYYNKNNEKEIENPIFNYVLYFLFVILFGGLISALFYNFYIISQF